MEAFCFVAEEQGDGGSLHTRRVCRRRAGELQKDTDRWVDGGGL